MERTRKISALAQDLINLNPRALIAIDGPAGSGKTTFANALALQLKQATVVHLDEIYNGWSDALTENLSQNLKKWIIEPFKNQMNFDYPVFDWHKNTYASTKSVNSEVPLILEGVGAGAKEVLRELDFLIWIEAELDLGLERVRKRDGEAVFDQMQLWREREAQWFRKNKTKENSHLIIKGDPPVQIEINKEFWPF